MLGYDDSLDAFGVHGIGGIIGALLTGVFADPAINGRAGLFFGNRAVTQAEGIVVTIVWTAVVTWVILMVTKMLVGLRPERAGGRRRPRHLAARRKRRRITNPGAGRRPPPRQPRPPTGRPGPTSVPGRTAPLPRRRASPARENAARAVGRGVQLMFLLARHRGFPLANRMGCTPRPIPGDPPCTQCVRGIAVLLGMLPKQCAEILGEFTGAWLRRRPHPCPEARAAVAGTILEEFSGKTRFARPVTGGF